MPPPTDAVPRAPQSGGEHPVDRFRGVLDGLDGDTGLSRDRPTIGVDGLDLVETGE